MTANRILSAPSRPSADATQPSERTDLAGDLKAEQVMGARTLEALHGSIRKWERIANEGAQNGGSGDCPLCHIYLVTRKNCVGCPVRVRTGFPNCLKTPYHRFVQASYAGNESAMREHAQAELDFLRSLLPVSDHQSDGEASEAVSEADGPQS